MPSTKTNETSILKLYGVSVPAVDYTLIKSLARQLIGATYADTPKSEAGRKAVQVAKAALDQMRLWSASAILILCAALVGCGGPMTPAPSATPSAITSAQVFSNTPQTWNFADGAGHHMTITPNPIACAFGSCGDITVWHFTKDSCLGYWANRTPEQCAVATNLDELYFALRHDADGAWRCIGFTDIDYLGVKRKVQINTVPGMAPPYTIIPAASNVSDPDTAYNALIQTLAFDADLTDFSTPTGGTAFSTTWRTDASQESGSLVSLQHEGCVTEHWDFSNGLTRIVPIVGLGNGGACLTLDTKLTMVRQ